MKMNFPKREHYEDFLQTLSQRLFPGTCFYLYGSLIREEDFVPGRSDVDGGFILRTEFITPRIEAGYLSRFLNNCLRHAEKEAGLSDSDLGIRVNLNLMDSAINRDGRFLAYDNSYTDYLKENAIIVAGPDIVQEMNGMNYKRQSLESAAHNLRKVRNGLLTYFFDLRKNPERARKTSLSSINLLWSMPKKLLESLGKEVKFERGAFFETFREIFPEYDSEKYEKAFVLRKDPNYYFGVLEDMDSAFDLSLGFLNATEEMIKGYVKRFPYPTNFEVRA